MMQEFRDQHADDICECGHTRSHHYGATGSTVGCHQPQCPCFAYALGGN